MTGKTTTKRNLLVGECVQCRGRVFENQLNTTKASAVWEKLSIHEKCYRELIKHVNKTLKEKRK
jgi:hypothetical protein